MSILASVFREIDEAGTGLLRLRLLEGLAYDLRNDFRFTNLGAVFGYGAKEVDKFKMLVALFVHARGGYLARDGNHGRLIHVGIRNPGDQVGSPRAQGSQRYACFSGQTPVDIGHEGSPLFMTRRDETNLAVEQDLHHIDVFLARYAEDAFDAFIFQTSDEEFSCFHSLDVCTGDWGVNYG